MQQGQYDRFRSFAERYLVARAGTFRAGHEREDAWQAIQDAKTAYNMVETASRDPDMIDNRRVEEERRLMQQANAMTAQTQQSRGSGMTGPPPPDYLKHLPNANTAAVLAEEIRASGFKEMLSKAWTGR